MSVRAILKSKGQRVVTVRRDTTIDAVVETLSREKIGAVVVSDDGIVATGLLGEREIITGLAERGADLPGLTAQDLMIRSFTHATMDMPMLHVLDLMTQGRFRHMPVLENGRLAGLISIGDVVKARLDLLENEAMHMKAYIGGHG